MTADAVPAGHEPERHPEHPHDHHLAEAFSGGAGEGTGRPGDATTEQLMADAIGGWRGLVDSSVPGALFLVVYVLDGNVLGPALWAAVGSGAVLAVLRLVRRESLQQVLSGFIGIAFCAWLASRSGRAEDFYLPGLLINLVYGLALGISALVGHPLLGYAVGAATGDITGWRAVPEQRRAYALATWSFVAVYLSRLVIQVPLYLAGAVGPLGVAKLALGWPLFALAGLFSWRLIRKARAEAPVPERADDALAREGAAGD
ncbi:MAG: DUF3159 domain-containing protein [Frankiales bacterium]|nr:DUF3159 domain-containing protein [Frankiales bacterium]